MCGRFAFFLPPSELQRLFGCVNLVNFPSRYNAAPMQDHAVIIRNRMGLARWGLLPPWAEGDEGKDDRALAAKMINARSETAAEKPAFRQSWHHARRCLVPANGFYEWYGSGAQTTPYYIHRKGGGLMAMAGLWAKTGNLVTFTVLTREADEKIRPMHDRMPVIFDPAQAAAWFAADAAGARRMIVENTVRDLAFYTVSRAVGKVANDSPGLIAPCAAELAQMGADRLF